MMYSIIGILASIILLFTNRDVLWNRIGEEFTRTQKLYRGFLLGVLSYYITDALWGILDAYHLTGLQFVDTSAYFIAMAAALLLWTRYVIAYLENENIFSRFLYYAGNAFFVLELAAVVVNLFYPVLFWFDHDGGYHAGAVRYVTLAVQIVMFLLISVYTLSVTSKSRGTVRLRHLTIGLFGIFMMILIAVQIAYPLLPFYAMGYMLGTCVLRSFVVEDEKEEYRRRLEDALERERRQKEELEESREALRDALSAAEEASKAKTAFLSNMSHEIRTPMNTIIGLDNIALHEPGISEATKTHLERIGSSAQHLLGIINDILDMSRIESGRMAIRDEEFSFAKSLEQVNTIIGGQCKEKGIEYNCQVIGSVDDYYIGDDMKLRQVMINILGNAVKFTPEGGKVTFQVEETARFDQKSTLKMTFSDTGIGMSEEYLPRIFEAFSQEDSSSTNKYGSTGLGMPITKSLVELMNGHMEVESEKGRGTIFTVTLTLRLSDRKIDDELAGVLHPDELCVLVIDDDPVACEHASVILGQVGVTCETASSGAEGLEMVKLRYARREAYNLILVDWKMPEMDGLETTRQIRKSVGEETPIIILTSYSWEDIVDEARTAGVDTFVAKPLFAGSVLDEFRDVFAKKNASLIRNTVDLKGRRILLAEDMAVNAEIMVMVLAMREIETDHAENGRIAVQKFAESQPGYYDAILMDMRMPEMDGLEAAKTIRAMQREDAKTIPIIALTANAFDEDVQRSMQAGLNAHLSKPVEPEVLFKTLESMIGTPQL